jgi:hypothetical protein
MLNLCIDEGNKTVAKINMTQGENRQNNKRTMEDEADAEMNTKNKKKIE